MKVLVVDDDATLLAAARTALTQAGMSVFAAATAAEAREAKDAKAFDLAVVDIHLADASGLDLLRELRVEFPRMPLVVLSRISAFTTKIEALRAGADAYFEKPVDWPSFSRSVLSLAEGSLRPASILIVDDDRVSAAILERVLQSEGYSVAICSSAAQFENTLRATNPDLVLMDIELPEISGFELTQYLRQDERFETVPVIYVTASDRDDRALSLDAAGGELILRKPVAADILLSTVGGRLGHFRRLRRLMDRDSLSGVLMRRPLLDRIDEAVALRGRDPRRRFSLAFIDLDHFKEVNDRHGHATGDAVIAALGDTLRRGVRATDAVGRYGGEEFAVLLPGIGSDEAVALVDRLRREFAEVGHPPAGTLHVTFSAGIAEHADGETAANWLARADQALYEAKASGRNCVRDDRQARGASPAPILNEQTIASLRELGELSGHDMLAELTGLFCTIAPERIAAIHSAIDRGDAAALRSAAHALRSAAGNLGATTMHLCCTELEEMGVTSSLDSAATCAARLSAAFEETRTALERLIAR